MRHLYVRDLMSSPVLTVSPDTRLPVVKRLMRRERVHRLLVVEHGELAGIITLGDVRNAFPSDVLPMIGAGAHLLDQVQARDVMRTGLITVAADTPIVEAAALLVRHKISGLPVLQGQRLVGIITKSDVCRAVAGDTFARVRMVASQFEQASAP